MDYGSKCISINELNIERAKDNARQEIISSINSQILQNELHFFENGYVIVSVAEHHPIDILESVLGEYRSGGWSVEIRKPFTAMFYQIKFFK